ncbi:hypothetical protein AMATHDRAFT_128921, partial [Amanita thiersii Skay4041]
IQRSIADGQDKLWQVEHEIMQYNSILGRLMERKKELEQDLTYKRALISPIRGLPPEILMQIFLEYCLPGELVQKDVTGRSPVVLSQVCRHWRAVAHACQPLW